MAAARLCRFIETKAWREAADGAIREALVNLESVPAPAGEMDVVLGAGWPGVMLHEASAMAGGRFQPQADLGFRRLMGKQGRARASPWSMTAPWPRAAAPCPLMTRHADQTAPC